jgi:hypothetical protein
VTPRIRALTRSHRGHEQETHTTPSTANYSQATTLLVWLKNSPKFPQLVRRLSVCHPRPSHTPSLFTRRAPGPPIPSASLLLRAVQKKGIQAHTTRDNNEAGSRRLIKNPSCSKMLRGENPHPHLHSVDFRVGFGCPWVLTMHQTSSVCGF